MCACVDVMHVCVCVQQDTSNSSFSFLYVHTHINTSLTHTHQHDTHITVIVASLSGWVAGIRLTSQTPQVHHTCTQPTHIIQTFLKSLVFKLEPQRCLSESQNTSPHQRIASSFVHSARFNCCYKHVADPSAEDWQALTPLSIRYTTVLSLSGSGELSLLRVYAWVRHSWLLRRTNSLVR